MRLFIPSLGTRLRLSDDWTFTLHAENRNFKMLGLYAAPYPSANDIWHGPTDLVTHPPVQKPSAFAVDPASAAFGIDSNHDLTGTVTLTAPAGTVLKVERIYIRKGAADFDSLTFRIVESPLCPAMLKHRFWTSLEDANKICCDPL